jgi:stage II sporulation protein D
MDYSKTTKPLKTAGGRQTASCGLAMWICFMGSAFFTGCGKRAPVEPAVGMDSPEQTWVRVLLFGNLDQCTIAAPGGFIVEGIDNGVTAEFSDTQPMRLCLENGRIRIGHHRVGQDVMIRSKDPYYFLVDDAGFRGNLHVRVTEDGTRIQMINHVPLESYLLGVIGAEMYSYWEPEALKAQTVAARTYCLAIQHRFGPARLWDVTRVQSSQMYHGLAAENARIRQAVLETTGQILVAKGSDGSEAIFPAYYSSSCGGHTENSQAVFGEDWINLPGVACPWCEKTTRRRDFFWGPVDYPIDGVSHRLMERYPVLQRLERIIDVNVLETGSHGRINTIELIGTNRQKDRLRGEDFRLALDPSGLRLRSTLVELIKIKDGIRFDHGRGFGHGVGLCQYGAQGLAREGCDYTEILSFYYPHARLVRIQTTAAQ